MKITIRFDYGTGPQEVRVTPGVVIYWERKTNSKVSKLESVGLGISDLALMAHEQLRRNGTVVPTLDKFENELLDIEIVDTTEPDPFPKAALEDQ